MSYCWVTSPVSVQDEGTLPITEATPNVTECIPLKTQPTWLFWALTADILLRPQIYCCVRPASSSFVSVFILFDWCRPRCYTCLSFGFSLIRKKWTPAWLSLDCDCGLFLLSSTLEREKEFDILPTVLCPGPDGSLNLIGCRAQRHSFALGIMLFYVFEYCRYSLSYGVLRHFVHMQKGSLCRSLKLQTLFMSVMVQHTETFVWVTRFPF